MAMSEFELLEAIAQGQIEFSRDVFPELDDVDRTLRRFAELGYISKVVRAVYPIQYTGRRLMRVDVVGGLTPMGEYRLRQHRWDTPQPRVPVDH